MEKGRFLEITVISAEDLRLPSRRMNKAAFITVQTDSHHCCSTGPDTASGSCPSWSEKLHLPLTVRSISVELYSKTSYGSRLVSSAEIPVSDIIEGYVPAHLRHFLSYRLRERDRKLNGIIDLSVKLAGSESIGRPTLQLKNSCMGLLGENGIPVRYCGYVWCL